MQKVCVVTGASSGIGRASALALAEAGWRVALVCRDPVKGNAILAEVRDRSPQLGGELFLADLSSQAQIRTLAKELLDKLPHIHLLLNNAGVVNLSYKETIDGIEEVFAVNHLAYFLLTMLLLDRLRASAPSRIVNVASDAHKFGKMNFEDLGNRARYKSMRVYGQSKLANIHFTKELARRLEGTGVTVNCVHPGAVSTGLGHNNGTLAKFLTKLLKPFFRTPDQGAATSIYAATAPELETVSGKYFANGREAKPSKYALDQSDASRLWAASCALTGWTNGPGANA